LTEHWVLAQASLSRCSISRSPRNQSTAAVGEALGAKEIRVEAGKYGVKEGGGFVTEAGDQTVLIAYRNRAYARLGQLLRELGPAPM